MEHPTIEEYESLRHKDKTVSRLPYLYKANTYIWIYSALLKQGLDYEPSDEHQMLLP